MLEILYLSVAVATGYQSQLLFRRAGPGLRAYATMLAIDAFVAAAAFAGTQLGEETAFVDLAGAIAIFGFVGLVLVPPILRDLARRALGRDWLGLAVTLTRLRELLSPGMGARHELELMEIVRAARSGNVEAAVASLRAQRDAVAADPRARAAVDDRIVLTLLSAARWQEAATAYERGRASGGPASAPLAVEMVRAYGELGDLERAVEIVAFLEGAPGAEEPPLLPLVARARMLLLAYAGRPVAVATALAPAGPLSGVPAAARAYWLGSAHHFAGDVAAARAELGRAVSLSRRDVRGRELARERLITPVGDARQLAPGVAAFVERAEAAAATVFPSGVLAPTRGATPATAALVAANLIVFAIVSGLLGSTQDGWVLARSGANLKISGGGEPWRLITSTFLHVGVLHLGVNMIGLWSVGRLVERMLGWLRFSVVYLAAGIGGSLASVTFGGPGFSAGASGAIFGTVGAAIAELVLVRREARGQAWRKLLLGNLLIVVVVQLAIGNLSAVIDQSAHVGGLVTGAAVTFLISPASPIGRSRAAARVCTALFAIGLGLVAASAVAVLVTPYGRTLERTGWERRTLGPVSLEVPRLWMQPDGEKDVAMDPTRFVTLQVKRIATEDTASIPYYLEKDGMTDIARVEPPPPAPPGWKSEELSYVEPKQSGGLPFHLILYTRDVAPGILFLSVHVPSAHLHEARPFVDRAVASVKMP